MASSSIWVLLTMALRMVVLSAAVRQVQQDASTSVGEHEWYHAMEDWVGLHEYCVQWRGERIFQCVDVFSFSRRFASTFAAHGYASIAFDIKGDARDDITTRSGFLRLLECGLATQPGAFMPVAPPCSLFVGISQGTHRRSDAWCSIVAFVVALFRLFYDWSCIFFVSQYLWQWHMQCIVLIFTVGLHLYLYWCDTGACTSSGRQLARGLPPPLRALSQPYSAQRSTLFGIQYQMIYSDLAWCEWFYKTPNLD